MANAVYCIATSRDQAERVVTGLQGAGIPLSEVSVLFPDRSGTRDFAHQNQTKAPEGATAGATAGGAIGGVLGLLAGIGALVGLGIPEVEAKMYEGKLRKGNILVSAHVEDDDLRARAKKVMEDAGAEDVHTWSTTRPPKDERAHVSH
jgi:hypothetical protein